MRKHTNRQVQKECINDIIVHLEKQIEFIVKQSELLLKLNGEKNNRIDQNCISSIIEKGSECSQKITIPDSKIEVV